MNTATTTIQSSKKYEVQTADPPTDEKSTTTTSVYKIVQKKIHRKMNTDHNKKLLTK